MQYSCTYCCRRWRHLALASQGKWHDCSHEAAATRHVASICTMTTATGARVLETANLFRIVIPIEQRLHDAHAMTTSLPFARRLRRDLSLWTMVP